MPTLYGAWQAGDRARIELDYTITYDSEMTIAFYDLSFFYATRNINISDNANNWYVSGDAGKYNGANIQVTHPPAGGRTLFKKLKFAKRGNLVVGASFKGIEGVGAETLVIQSFTVQAANLAPTVVSAKGSNVTTTSFLADLTSVSVYSGSPTNARVVYNTYPEINGSKTINRGSYGDILVSGLYGNTTYHFCMSIANSTYGWGPWSKWFEVTTLPNMFVKVNNVWKPATPYAKIDGYWVLVKPNVKVGGVWKT